MLKTYIFIQPSTREDDDMVGFCFQQSDEALDEIFRNFVLSDFQNQNIVKYVPHSNDGSLEGYLILETNDYKNTLNVIKELITLTDTGWGEPYYYFAVFTLDGDINKFTLNCVNQIKYYSQVSEEYNNHYKELLVCNDVDDLNFSFLDNLIEKAEVQAIEENKLVTEINN